MSGPCVLIADDDAHLVDALERRCRSLGLGVDTARDAMTALKRMEIRPPDLVILDVDMPQGNGLSVCEMMLSHEDLRSIPVIILTGKTDRDTVRRCHSMCAYYVTKCDHIWPHIEPLLVELLDLETEDHHQLI